MVSNPVRLYSANARTRSVRAIALQLLTAKLNAYGGGAATQKNPLRMAFCSLTSAGNTFHLKLTGTSTTFAVAGGRSGIMNETDGGGTFRGNFNCGYGLSYSILVVRHFDDCTPSDVTAISPDCDSVENVISTSQVRYRVGTKGKLAIIAHDIIQLDVSPTHRVFRSEEGSC